MHQLQKGIDNDASTQWIYLSFCLTHFLNSSTLYPCKLIQYIQACISQMKEVCRKPDILSYAAYLLNEGTEDC